MHRAASIDCACSTCCDLLRFFLPIFCRKFLVFQLCVNVVALFVASLGALILAESPLKAVQLLWVNLIMDTFASLALATEGPTPDLLLRKPYGKDESLISRPMMRSIIGHSLYQAGVLTWIVFFGHHIFDCPIGKGLGHSALPTQHYTMVFHVFVLIQAFSEVNARKINNERNVFSGVLKNAMFTGIVFCTVVVQYVLVIVGGRAMGVTPPTLEMHVAALVVAVCCLFYNQAVLSINPELFLVVGSQSADETDKRFAWATRRNSRQSIVRMPTKSGNNSFNS